MILGHSVGESPHDHDATPLSGENLQPAHKRLGGGKVGSREDLHDQASLFGGRESRGRHEQQHREHDERGEANHGSGPPKRQSQAPASFAARPVHSSYGTSRIRRL